MFIVVGVTGGIAAYKSVHLVRLLVQQGHEVHVIPTEDSLRFIGLTTWEAISRNPVTTSVHDDVARVRAVREAMGPEGRVRIDANGAWNVDEAERAVHALAEFDLDGVALRRGVVHPAAVREVVLVAPVRPGFALAVIGVV